MEMFIMKWTFGFVILSIPVLFAVKVGILCEKYLIFKWAKLQAWLYSPEMWHTIIHNLMEAIKGGVN